MLFLPPKDFSARLVRKESLNEDTFSLWYEPVGVDFEFFAGQFVMVKLPPELIKDGDVPTRSYSISSAPRKDGLFELCVGIIPNGIASNYLAKMEVGDSINVKAPFGICYIKPENKNNLVMIATGTGIAPIKALLEQLAEQKDSRQIDVLFGVRYAENLFYLKELKDLVENLENSRVILTLSRPHELWTGHEGRVTAHLQDLEFDPAVTDFYLCGNSDMIKEVRLFALNAGISPRNIRVELFD